MPDFEIYCDESRQELFYDKDKSRHGYVLIGGIWLKADERQRLKEEFRKLRSRYELFSEFKWSKVSLSRMQFYLDVVHFFFHEEALRFRTIVLRNDELDALEFHEGDVELMFYKFYYQLIKHWLEDGKTYRVFVDLKTSRKKDRLRTLKKYLQWSNIRAVVEFVQALPSAEVDFLQLADLLIGAVGSHYNRDTASPAKRSVRDAIEEHLGHPIEATGKGVPKFNVFRCFPGSRW